MNRTLLYFSFICAIGFTCCARTHDERLFMVEKNDLFGYVSTSGDTIIPCIYPFLYPCTSHLGFIPGGNRKIVCIDTKGNKLFYVFMYDNGPDYPEEGLFRITDEDGLIGYADTLGKVVIPPTYKCAYPFENGKAKVAKEGQIVYIGEHSIWESSSWTYIDNPLMKKGK